MFRFSKSSCYVIVMFFSLFCCVNIALAQNDNTPKQLTPNHSKGKDSDIVYVKTIVRASVVVEARKIEHQLRENSHKPASKGESTFKVLKGNSLVLVIAPHATRSTRNGKVREFADSGTGSLAVMLNKLAKTTSIYTVSVSPYDANYSDDNNFKRKVGELLKEIKPAFVLDLHRANIYRPFDVDFGTMDGKSLLGHQDYLNLLYRTLKNEGLENISKGYFKASKQDTITKYIYKKGIPCIQVEINGYWAGVNDTLHSAHRYAQLLQGLVKFVNKIDEKNIKKHVA